MLLPAYQQLVRLFQQQDFEWPFEDRARLSGSHPVRSSLYLVALTQNFSIKGFVVSDWGAQHAGVASAEAGLDMAMPGAAGFWGERLVEAVKNGSLPESRVTDMAMR